jgi:hypothetical protein
MVAQGFSNFTAVDVAGNKVAASTLGSSASSGTASNSTGAAAVSSPPAAVASPPAIACGGTTLMTVTRAVSLLFSYIKLL